jgi:hypothetical protein
VQPAFTSLLKSIQAYELVLTAHSLLLHLRFKQKAYSFLSVKLNTPQSVKRTEVANFYIRDPSEALPGNRLQYTDCQLLIPAAGSYGLTCYTRKITKQIANFGIKCN